ncbi:MAG TPA: FkbM family methyltransferase [Stellaceae bacterium]
MLKRLIPSLRKRRAELSRPEQYRLVRREGLLFLANYHTWACRQVIVHGVVERPQTEFLLTTMAARRCRLFFDIGAHMGIYSMLVAQRRLCDEIVAFEPNPKSFAHLKANLLINDMLAAIDAREIAISDVDGEVPFDIGPPTYDVWSKVGGDGATTTVRAAKLDTLFTVSGQSIAIKIDVELHELAAVAGMTALLRHNDCVLQVESFEEQRPALVRALGDLGYAPLRSIGHDHYFARA